MSGNNTDIYIKCDILQLKTQHATQRLLEKQPHNQGIHLKFQFKDVPTHFKKLYQSYISVASVMSDEHCSYIYKFTS